MAFLIRHQLLAACLAACAAGAGSAAPVVVTPNSLAGYTFYPPLGGGPSGVGAMQETLQTCFVEPARGDRTLAMATRYWAGLNRPLTVFYRLVGGGGGAGKSAASVEPRFGGGGGSTAILRNGSLVSTASGAPSAGAATAAAPGQFQLTSTDTLRLVVGGGGGGGYRYSNYTGVYTYYALPGGGGAGYFGGGAGSNDPVTLPMYGNPADLAQGGTGSAGGRGGLGQGAIGAGISNAGGSSALGASGGNGASQGANGAGGGWDGFRATSYLSGGGGALGRDGTWSGWTACLSPYDPTTSSPRSSRAARPTAFALDSVAGSAGYIYSHTASGGGFYDCGAGGVAGQIVLQYQAPACNLIPNWDEP
jgi:hypothetical protein